MWETWQNFSGGIFEFAKSAYSNVEPWTLPLFLLGFIGYVYTATHSITALVVAIIGTFALWMTSTAIFVDVEPLVLLLNIVTIIGVSALLFTLFMRRVVNK